jgi:chromosome segregation protein
VLFDLSDGITGFVGPNGCGKSNIVDAVKWGLGEQRVSSLRGDVMQDVIFKGNGRRAPLNFAEVSLIFANDCGTLPVEFEEVVVTRRLLRTNESEYLLNRTPCRLKDIRNLFYDTGVGVNAYSVMEQGKIDSILQTDPVSRRIVFEEASGISRFKARRKEAERKLERTQANLLRLGDIIEELEKRIRSLKNQAGRARNYLKYSERLKELKRDHFLHTYRLLLQAGSELGLNKKAAESEAEKHAQALRAQKEDKASLEAEITLLGETIFAKKNQLTEARTALEETESKIGYFEKRAAELGRERVELDERERSLTEAIEGKEKDFQALNDRRDRLQKEEEQIQEDEARILESESRAEEECASLREKLAGIKSRLLELTTMELDLKNKTVEADAHYHSALGGFIRLTERQNDLSVRIAEAAQNLKLCEAETGSKEKERDKLRTELDEGEKQANRLEEDLCHLDVNIKEMEAELIKRESRIEVLQNLIERKEGVSSGVKAVLNEAGSKDSPLSFVKGMLGELLEVDVAHSAALEAALGGIAEAIVVEDIDQARQVMEFLHEEKRGRATLLPLSEIKESIQTPGQASPNSSLTGHVRCGDPLVEQAMKALLTDVHIIEKVQLIDREVTRKAAKSVTLDGDHVERSGIMSVGGTTPEGGVISRRSELSALNEECEKLKQKLEDLQRERLKIEAKSQSIFQANQELSSRIAQDDKGLSELIAKRENHLERWMHLRREYFLNAHEACELEKNFMALKTTLSDLNQEMGRVGEELETLSNTVQTARGELDARQEEKERFAQSRREKELQKMQVRERREGLEKEHRLLKKNLEEVRETLDSLAENRERLAVTRRDIEQELEEMKRRVDELMEQRSGFSVKITEDEERQAKLKGMLEQSHSAAEGTEQVLEEVKRKIDDLRVEEHGNTVRIEGLLEKAMEELRLDLKEAQALESVDADPDRDWQATESEIIEIKDRLARMGNVNIEAINELQEVEERYEGLITQREDLHQSIKSLEDLIATLNRESREKFIETFERVRSHFNDIFRKLFQGGRADVRLREGEDVLEAGIEIIAGPPGKDVRSISLLSGGERTLTAVGLLFALFKSRPSPFCILDEVDAALDEVNIERFCTLLGEYVHDSQFLIVTHSKRTMSYCDFLYGITMQEDGVTSHISLNLEDYEEQVVTSGEEES